MEIKFGWLFNFFDSYWKFLALWIVTNSIFTFIIFPGILRLRQIKPSLSLKIYWLVVSLVPWLLVSLMFVVQSSQSYYLEQYIYGLYLPVVWVAMLFQNMYILVTLLILWTILLLGIASILPVTLVVIVWKKTNISAAQIVSAFVPISVSVLTGVMTLLLFIKIQDQCRANIASFHEINAHLKDVCSTDKWQSECPRTSADLYNYSHRVFDGIASCGSWSYSFNEFGKGTFVVKWGKNMYVSDDRLGPERYSYFYLPEDSYPDYLEPEL